MAVGLESTGFTLEEAQFTVGRPMTGEAVLPNVLKTGWTS
jgi:hypothetical protein